MISGVASPGSSVATDLNIGVDVLGKTMNDVNTSAPDYKVAEKLITWDIFSRSKLMCAR